MFRMNKSIYLCILLVNVAITIICGHSWIECTDYRIENDAQKVFYDPSICFGHPRCGMDQAAVPFGQDTGLNNQGQNCQCGANVGLESNYKGISAAQYTPGQRVCLAYPSKNHVADTCTNQYIPDNGMRIFRSKVQDTVSDAFDGNEYQHHNGKHVNGVIDYKGFQNCPNFCKGQGQGKTDRVLCTMCFDLENDLVKGKYSFKWVWEFNPGSFYTTCWEANIV